MPQSNKGGSVDLAAAAAPFILLAGKTYLDSTMKKGAKPSIPKKRVSFKGRRVVGGGVPPASGTPTGDASATAGGNTWSIQDNLVASGSSSTGVATMIPGLSPSTSATKYAGAGGKGRKTSVRKTKTRKHGGGEGELPEPFVSGPEGEEPVVGGGKGRKTSHKKRTCRGGNGDAAEVLLTGGGEGDEMTGGRRRTVRKTRTSKSRRGGGDEDDNDSDGEEVQETTGGRRSRKTHRKSRKGGSQQDQDDQQDQQDQQDQEGGKRKSHKSTTHNRKSKLRGGALQMYSQQLQELTKGLQNLLD